MIKKIIIRKKDGSKRIVFDCDKLQKRRLRRINSLVLSQLQDVFCEHAHAYIIGRNTYTNAETHVNKKISIKMDLKDFFHSIDFEKIDNCRYFSEESREYLHPDIDVFIKAMYGNTALKIIEIPITIARFIKDNCFVKLNKKMVSGQGLPTSPAISNIVFAEIDSLLFESLKQLDNEVSYSRYSDDITISTNNEDKEFHSRIISVVTELVNKSGFTINESKTEVMSKKQGNRIICGLAVDEGISIPKRLRKKARAIEHNAGKNPESKNFAHQSMSNYIENVLNPPRKFNKEQIAEITKLWLSGTFELDGSENQDIELVKALLKSKNAGKAVSKMVFDNAYFQNLLTK
jgi:hypothetical protein